MSSYLFSLLLISSGVSSVQFTDLTFGECIDQLIKEETALDIVRRRYPDIELSYSCKLQHD